MNLEFCRILVVSGSSEDSIMIKDLLDLFFPPCCTSCGNLLPPSVEYLCIHCQLSLHRTHYHQLRSNPVEKHFWGRLKIERATSFLHFKPKGIVQKIVHQLKYQEQSDLGYAMGKLCARELQSSAFLEGIEIILPVPIHPKKLKIRGYNQAAAFGRGVSSFTGIPIDEESLLKEQHTDSQTKKSRYHRFENVRSSFVIKSIQNIQGKHILLVDDVITTGSTLEACGTALKDSADCRISILTLAATE